MSYMESGSITDRRVIPSKEQSHLEAADFPKNGSVGC